MTNFDLFRRHDGTIDLHQAWRTTGSPRLQHLPTQRVQAAQFFHRIEAHQPIRSSQVAAIALATLHLIIREKEEKVQ